MSEENCPHCGEPRQEKKKECSLCGFHYEQSNQTLFPFLIFFSVFAFALLYTFASKNNMQIKFVKILIVIVTLVLIVTWLEERSKKPKYPHKNIDEDQKAVEKRSWR